MFLLQEAFHCRLTETKGARGLRNNKAPFQGMLFNKVIQFLTTHRSRNTAWNKNAVEN